MTQTTPDYQVGVPLEHPIMNAAGTCKTLEQVQRLARSDLAAIVVGSVPPSERAGNSGETYWGGPHYALNALGLPSPGPEYYIYHLPRMVDTAHEAGKPLFLSIAGFSPDEYGHLAQLAHRGGVDGIEVNLGCPNVWDGGLQKRIAAFDPVLIRQIVSRVTAMTQHRVPIGLKLSPYSDPQLLQEVGQIIAQLGMDYVVSTNTFPNSLELDSVGTARIGVGLAGLSGPAMKPIGLGQIRQLADLLSPAGITLVGVGGISTGADVRDYLRVGASAVQVATAYFESHEDPNVFGQIHAEFAELCQEADAS